MRQSDACLYKGRQAGTATMLHCSVICSLMIAIFICEQPGTCWLVDVVMLNPCFPDSQYACCASALLAERRA
ncbi:TPA: hypothetical protein HH295_14000 [Xanthomonas vasicola pv. zeae]|uniref:Uncharacterized protein n=2 Tax=Xanthomonas vasicola TaxID=56459 RepID=A0ABD7S8Y8_XANVA|nr:hypothetical protein C7V42_21345 [Xanthomonas vasicola pv. vasculorum]AZR25071.1 hypothetical protein NX81_022245 [Xanthomonas vasicola]AZR29136.1 hypothetical protein NX80_021800 [Xanthomonas vasicola pv. arecae]AZR33034.1 hypothetical protein KWO_018410 [Xanthomonas vasicola pv. musacearum NCPPB 4379]MBV6743404.1 hypothetical protein [Xanthomonas vasicola pv. musacearum NCPPB 2251]MBV6746369.1 hypothetical protein [Xanthomonas vasicola pv. vasculorum NCPPB 890]MBV7279666.1 hypothetical p